jgi:hypothetical protein
MRGTVRVYQAYDEKPIFEESNLIVDGFKEHIVDIMTRVPAPSAVSADVSASYNTSNFTVQAMSFSPNESNFDRIHSLACLSAHVNTTGGLTAVDPGDGKAWSYREDIPNPQFSAVNWRGTPASNSILKNNVFSSTTDFFKNTTFKDYTIDYTLSGFYVNQLLSLYELPNWRIQSELRFNPSSNEFEDTYEYGSCARYDMSANLPDVSTIYGALSGTEASSTYAEPDDGILYIRSFAPSSTGGDSSGAVVLRQTASVYSIDMEPWVSIEDETALDVVAEIKFQFSSISGVAGAEIHVTAKDTVTGESYNFGTTPEYSRHSWGGGGSALVVNASADVSGTVSKFINVPKSKVKHPLEISYSFYSNSESDQLNCYFWNPSLRIIDDWYVGNIWSGGDLATVSGNDFQSSGMFIDLSNVNSNFSATDLSNVTYISQLANMSPTKVYSYLFSLESNPNASVSDTFRGAVLKRYASNMADQGRYNLLATPSASALNETRLDGLSYAISPELNRKAGTKYDAQDALVKSSDLCLQVSSSVSGSFACSANRTFIFKGEVCKEFYNGLSSAPVAFILETSGFNSDGERLKFNFETGNWVPSGDGTVLDSSSIFNAGRFSPFESTTIDPVPLLREGVPLNSDGAFDFILTVSSTTNQPAFFRALRMESLALPAAQQQKELFQFANSFMPKTAWQTVQDGVNVFSGFTVNNVAEWAEINLIGIAGMESASGSIHSYDSTYQFMICRDTVSNGTAAGELSRITGAYCTDAALVAVEDEIEEDTLTSERYFRSPRRNIVGKPYVMMNDFSSLYGISFYNPIPYGLPEAAPQFLFGLDKDPGLFLYNNAVSLDSKGQTSLCQSFKYSDLTLPVDSEGVAFSFSYFTVWSSIGDAVGNNPVKWSVNANTSTGKIVHWDAATSSWSEDRRGEETRNDFVYTVSGTPAGGPDKFTRTTTVDITNQDFDENTVVTFSIVMEDFANATGLAGGSRRWLLINDWRFYNVTASAMFDLGAFPAPEETTVQPIKLPAGRLGQFTNNIEIPVSGISEARALGSANWGPDPATSALSGSTGVIASTHNIAGCVNSDGFVYSGQGDANFNLSGFTVSTTASSIVHTIDLSATDVNFFDLQGGIGAMGLWAFDVDKTYAKLLDNGYSLSSVYDKPGASGELYNVTDTDRNPVFKLLAKKVFRQPITIASGLTNPSLRIVWEINFL